MHIDYAERKLREITGGERVLRDEPMAEHISFRAGGPADLFFRPRNAEELAEALNVLRGEQIPVVWIGAGTNVIVPSAGVRGCVLSLDSMAEIRRDGHIVTAQAGAKLSRIAQLALQSSLTGFEFACGIPGSAGGATAMNAGAYGEQLSDCVTSAKMLLDGRLETLSGDEMDFGYRHSFPLSHGAIVLETVFALREGEQSAISEKMNDLNRRRREKQPLEYPSAGSVFKRPEGNFAGALIEQAGLKGLSVGGARVSEKHAGFIINAGGATGDDILALIALVQKAVYEHSGVRLEREVRVLGEDDL